MLIIKSCTIIKKIQDKQKAMSHAVISLLFTEYSVYYKRMKMIDSRHGPYGSTYTVKCTDGRHRKELSILSVQCVATDTVTVQVMLFKNFNNILRTMLYMYGKCTANRKNY